MLDLNASSLDRAWLPSLDLHEEDGELVLHADLQDLNEEVEVSIDGSDLVLHTGRDESAHSSRVPLPFPLQAHPMVCRPSAEVLEVRIRIPGRGELQ